VIIPGTVRGSFPVVTGAASACPPSRSQEQLWDGFFAGHYRQNRLARRVFSSAGVRQRHCVVDPLQEDVSSWSTGRRMARYIDEAVPLAADAVSRALAAADLRPVDVGLLAVVGEGMRGFSGVAGRIFTAISRENVNIIAIAQGSSELTISIVVRRAGLEKAVRAVHAECHR